MARAPHPIVESFLGKVLDVERRVIVAREEDLAALTQQLVALGPTKELSGAVLAVLELATFVEQDLQSPAVAAAIAGATQPTLALLKSAGGAGADAVKRLDEAGQRFEKLIDTAAVKTPIESKPPSKDQVRAGPFARFQMGDKTKK